MDTIGLGRMGVSMAFGGAFANFYGGLTPMQAAAQAAKQAMGPFGFRGLGAGLGMRSAAQVAGTVAGTSATNAVLIGGVFSSGVLIGSVIRSGVNKTFSKSACGCAR